VLTARRLLLSAGKSVVPSSLIVTASVELLIVMETKLFYGTVWRLFKKYFDNHDASISVMRGCH